MDNWLAIVMNICTWLIKKSSRWLTPPVMPDVMCKEN